MKMKLWLLSFGFGIGLFGLVSAASGATSANPVPVWMAPNPGCQGDCEIHCGGAVYHDYTQPPGCCEAAPFFCGSLPWSASWTPDSTPVCWEEVAFSC